MRISLTTSTGSVQVYTATTHRGTRLEWIREEGLSSIEQALFVQLPLPEVVVGADTFGIDESFSDRLKRQISAAKGFPTYADAFVKRLISTGSNVPIAPQVHFHDDGSLTMTSDTYGLSQILVTVTSYGKIYGLSTLDGSVLWSRKLGLGWAEELGANLIPVKLSITRGSEVVLVVQRKAQNVSPTFDHQFYRLTRPLVPR